MTPTPNPTAEQIVQLVIDAYDEMGNLDMSNLRVQMAEVAVETLRAHGLLSEGAPSEEQVERAAREWYEQANGYETWASASGQHQQVVRVRAAKALTAAGVTQQEPKCEHGVALIDLCQFADHVANDEPADREKLIAEAMAAVSTPRYVGAPWPAAKTREVEAYVKGVNRGDGLIRRLTEALAASRESANDGGAR